MGIPSYFSYIIKNYPNIIQKRDGCEPFDHLFMDCNSIVYDAYNNIEKKHLKTHIDVSNIETLILNIVVENIKGYIRFISPKHTVFITFDGVSPFAKMSQQKTRRYKSVFLDTSSKKLWNTTNITPGTTFMNSLSIRIHNEFKNKERDFNVKKINISCSDEHGEGEHKLFQYIRDNDVKTHNVAVYGLDSDLIMLSIFHRQYVNSIFVFREAPEFKSLISQDKLRDPTEKLFLDIGLLSQSIFNEMGTDKSKSVNDYIFLCFFLGNDFLPHFPAFNIRTHGIQILMDTYRITIGKYPDRALILNNKIQWKWVSVFLNEIAKNEHEYILNEYFVRDKMDGRVWANNTHEEREQILQNIPVIYREDEKYISPNHVGWEKRYYKQLFDINPSEENIKIVCINYLEGLEWVYKYYTVGCPDWKWKYHSSYPPLVKDLVKYLPKGNFDFIQSNSSRPFTPYLQLAYVLPRVHFNLLPEPVNQFLLTNFSEYYPIEYKFKWAFCRYFWEAHPVLPEIPIETLEKWNSQFSKLQ